MGKTRVVAWGKSKILLRLKDLMIEKLKDSLSYNYTNLTKHKQRRPRTDNRKPKTEQWMKQ
jgi:hypothetical protein